MISKDRLQEFPTKRIKPVDGMAVTAEVWEEAHEHHRQNDWFHAIFHHGTGVVTGLEVIASDPPDTSVYILPGVAVDPAGRTIVMPQPVSYDIGDEMEGLLYLLLSYGESRPRADRRRGQEERAMYVHTEFSVSARTALPNTPWVELARIERHSRNDPFLDAENPAEPGPNEIDLRFRREIGAPREISVAVCYLGESADKKPGRGAGYMAQALNYGGRYHVTVQDDVPLAPGVEANALIYLVGQGEFELSSGQTNGLFNHITRGRGTLFIESRDPAAESSFRDILRAMDMQPEPLQPGHRLLVHPHFFVAPPPGFETEGSPEVLVSDGVILSTCGYGLIWQGEIRDGEPSREQIRSAIEWGGNIVAYARDRRRR